MSRSIIGAMLALSASLSIAFPAMAEATLSAVKKRGELACGVSGESQGFSLVDSHGQWSGIDVDFCRALAAAVLSDARKVRFVKLTPVDRFESLKSGAVDVLAANITVTLQREAGMGLQVGVVNYYDGQAFVVAKKSGVTRLAGLSGQPICVGAGTTHRQSATDWFLMQGLRFEPVTLYSKKQMYEAFFAGKCIAITEDSSALAAAVVGRANAADYMQLPEVISQEPLAPYVRGGDDAWLSIVRWVQYAMFEAEALSLSQSTVDDQGNQRNPAIRRLLGVVPGNGKALGLDEKWAYNIIKQVGHYGESYDRNIGADSPLKFERGINALWTKGGLMYPVPLR